MQTTKKLFTQGGFQFDARRGQWSLAAPGDDRGGAVKNAGCRLMVNGKMYSPAQADALTITPRGWINDGGDKYFRLEAEALFHKPGFAWTLWFDVAAQGVNVRISSAIRNNSRSALVLGNCDLWVVERAGGGGLRLGPRPEAQSVFTFDGGLSTQHVKRVAADGGMHKTGSVNNPNAYLQHIHDPVTQNTLLAGFVSFDRMRTNFQCRYDARKKSLDCLGSCLFKDFTLKPGTDIKSEILRVELAVDPYIVLTRWADCVAEHYRPRICQKPAVGWCGGWVDKRVESPELRVERNLRAIRARLRGFGLEYLWISIANLKDGLPGNWLECNGEFFPHGFRNTLKKIIRAGIKPGLWTGLFYINEAAGAAFAENRENLYRDHETGRPRPRGGWLWAHKAKDGAEPQNYILDCSHPRSLQYLKKIYAAYRKWGIRYYMLDFLDSGPMKDKFMLEDYHDQSMIRGPGIPRRGMLAARKAAGADTHLLTASGGTLANTIGLVDTMRIGADYGEGRGLHPRFPSYPATYVINGSYGSCGSPQDNCLQNTAAFFFTHRKFFLNGQNLLTVDHPIPRNEAEFSATLFGMTGGSIMLGDDMDRISADRLDMIKKVLPRPADWPFPADLFKRVYPDDYTRVLAAPVRTKWGAWSVVAVFNLDERTAVTEITMPELRLPTGKIFRVWDFWNARYCGCVRDKFGVEVPPKSCRLLRLSALPAQPTVLATDMHVRQGQLELTDVAWDKHAHVLRGAAVRPRGERGNVYIAAPPGWKPADYTGIFVAKDARDGTLIIRKPLLFKRNRADWVVPFAPLNAEEKFWQAKHKLKLGADCREII